jgi:hypothetical protein
MPKLLKFDKKLKGEQPPRKKVEKELDKLCSKIVRSKGACEKCGRKTNLQCAHIFTRSYKGTRWDLENLVCLCGGCHLFWAHKDPEAFRDWLIAKMGDAKYTWLKIRAYATAHFTVTELLLLKRQLEKEGL